MNLNLNENISNGNIEKLYKKAEKKIYYLMAYDFVS